MRLRPALPLLLALAFLAAGFLACVTSPTGRSQLLIFPDAEIAEMGVAAFQQIESEKPRSADPTANRRVRCVAETVVTQAPGEWEVVVFEDETPNAFALPGGKIGVHTGMLRVAETPDQLAAVIGHEVGHVLARHSNERVSTAYAAQIGASGLAAAFKTASPQTQQLLIGALGLGTQYGVLLPFSRAQESEADVIGLELMAKAGFDPRESVALWENMAAAGAAGPPEFLSTHPSSATRIQNLDAQMPGALRLYEQAQAAGRRPRCP